MRIRDDDRSFICELAEYTKGNRGDPDGYYASFFQVLSNGFCPVNELLFIATLRAQKLRVDRINYGDPRKKRTINFW